MSGIYIIKNTKNGKVYVGSSKNIEKRWKEHERSLKSGKHHSKKLQRAYDRAVDKSIFVYEAIEEVTDNNVLFDREQYYIDTFDSYRSGYNCSEKSNDPSRTTATGKKKEKKEKAEALCAKFEKLYSKSYVEISSKFLSRILDRHYGPSVLKPIVDALERFVADYDTQRYKVRILYEGRSLCVYAVDDYGEIAGVLRDSTREGMILCAYDTDILERGGLIKILDDASVTWIEPKYPSTRGTYSHVKRACASRRVVVRDGELWV